MVERGRVGKMLEDAVVINVTRDEVQRVVGRDGSAAAWHLGRAWGQLC